MRIATAEDAARLLAPWFADTDVERVVALHLCAGGQLLGATLEASGGPGDVEVPVRGIVAAALRTGAQSVVVAHNHPSGDPAPSEADLDGMRRLADALRAVDVRLEDALIFAGPDVRSFRVLGLL